jgi:4-amino-4-deoxy-L-arabinose transferase-like glycosyltransferase
VTPSPRLQAVVLALLIVAYALPGLVGHDPWKPDEPYTFGAVLNLLKTGDWVVPVVGAQPFVEKPPLYYWLASGTARLASPWLALHDAARLATLVLGLVSLAALAVAARLLWGKGAAVLATLLFLGTLGLEENLHRMQVDLALLAGFAIALAGFAGCIRDRWWGGAVLGLGMGIGFLGKGLLAPAVIGVTAILLPLFFAAWRTRHYFLQLVYAIAVALPFFLIWPLALLARSERLFQEWIWDNNLGRFSGYSTSFLGAISERGAFVQNFAWFLFPLYIYAVLAVVREGRRAWYQPAMQIGFTMALVLAIVLGISASLRALYFLPLVPPLALAAVAALQVPEARWQKAFGVFSIVAASAIAVVMWSVWAMLVLAGGVPDWLALGLRLPTPFAMPVSLPAVVAAILLTAGFAALARIRDRVVAPGLTLWVAALALGWGLVHTLWLPWLDAARSYRSVFAEIAKRLPAGTKCIVMDGPGESERAMIEYFTGVTPRQRFVREEECRALLWKGSARLGHPLHGWGLEPAWKGSRPGDSDERFDLIVKPW